ncbi:hypothetical protein FACS189483_11370 [Spirochaetia bacterium]|nr:hypothetical protein FACS189483_11370 [Spirochaetia bacterium]
MLKKFYTLLVLFLMVIFPVASQTASPIDLIVILDTSSSMNASYQQVNTYVTGPFLREFLRLGDTFHLISFSDAPRTEVVRRIEGVGDMETIIGRLFLMYPLEPYSDIGGALDYAERYIAALPASRQKQVVLITDGDHNPRSGAPTPVPRVLNSLRGPVVRVTVLSGVSKSLPEPQAGLFERE